MGENKLKVEYLPVASLVPYARNSRTHSDEQVAQIAASIREFGFTNPVLISPENDIIAGHGRVMAASRLGMELVPCIRLGHLTETQRRAYVIADNRLALNAGWDTAMLSIELQDLQAAEFDLELMGFDAKELRSIIGTANGEAEPATPPVDSKQEFLIVIECESEEHQRDLFEELQIREVKCKIM